MPQPFEVVIAAPFGQESVHHDVAEVNQHPPVLSFAFYPPGGDVVLLFHFFRDVAHDGFKLPFARSRDDDEIVSNGGNLTHIHQDNIFAFDVRRKVDDCTGEI